MAAPQLSADPCNKVGFLTKAQLIGNLGRDPEVRSMQNGGSVVILSIATSEIWKDRQSGERREMTTWHRVIIFNEGLGSIAEQYLVKAAAKVRWPARGRQEQGMPCPSYALNEVLSPALRARPKNE